MSDTNKQIRNQIARKSKRDETDYDYYPTPPWAVRVLLERINIEGYSVWEPAAGRGHMVKAIKEFNPSIVFATDIKPRAKGIEQLDFLNSFENRRYKASVIITNPPYSSLNDFMRVGLDMEPEVFALFVRLPALESQTRGSIYRLQPPSQVFVFSERVQGIAPGGFDMDKQSMQAYCWVVWEKGQDDTRLRWIPAGTAERLEREGDYDD